MKYFIIACSLLFLAGCSRKNSEPESHTVNTTPIEEVYPSAILQTDGTILLFTKVMISEDNNKEVISEYIIPEGDPLHQTLSRQINGTNKRQPITPSSLK